MIIGNVDVKSKKSEVQKEFLEKAQKALEEIGLNAESYAKLLCPVDTGNLRDSISHEGHELTEYIGTNVEYASYVELGARGRPAQPYLQPAVKGHLEEYRLIVKKELEE